MRSCIKRVFYLCILDFTRTMRTTSIRTVTKHKGKRIWKMKEINPILKKFFVESITLPLYEKPPQWNHLTASWIRGLPVCCQVSAHPVHLNLPPCVPIMDSVFYNGQWVSNFASHQMVIPSHNVLSLAQWNVVMDWWTFALHSGCQLSRWCIMDCVKIKCCELYFIHLCWFYV